MITNIFITGEKGLGKSQLINGIIQSMGLSSVGFKTLPYEIRGNRKGFFLSGLVDINEDDNNKPISVITGPSTCIPIVHTFDHLGVRILEESLLSSEQLILMDELGILEMSSKDFVLKVQQCLDHDKIVIGALKKADVPFINNIKKRNDTMVYELVGHNYDAVHEQVEQKLKNILKR